MRGSGGQIAADGAALVIGGREVGRAGTAVHAIGDEIAIGIAAGVFGDPGGIAAREAEFAIAIAEERHVQVGRDLILGDHACEAGVVEIGGADEGGIQGIVPAADGEQRLKLFLDE